MQFALAGLVCACVVAIPAAVVAALLLRLAISITNRLVGPVKMRMPEIGGIPEWDWDEWNDEHSTAKPERAARNGSAIPEPGVLKGTVIVFATALGAGLGFIVMGLLAEAVGLRMHRGGTQLVIMLFDWPVAACVLTAFLVAVLPTTFWRAALVAFVYNLIIAGLIVGFGGAAYVLVELA